MKMIINLDKAKGRDCARLRTLISEIREREMFAVWDAAYPDHDVRFLKNAKHETEIVRVDRRAPAWNRVFKMDIDDRRREWRAYTFGDPCELIFEDWGGPKREWVEITGTPEAAAVANFDN